jgi:hypothetical protein
MRERCAVLAVLYLVACGGNPGGDDDGDGGDGGMQDCVGLECQIADCAKEGKPPTALTGTVHAPNGTLPLYGVNVYVPRAPLPLPPFPEGVQCSRCTDRVPGDPLTLVRTRDPVGAPAGSRAIR